jgi:hypothetical protein
MQKRDYTTLKAMYGIWKWTAFDAVFSTAMGFIFFAMLPSGWAAIPITLGLGGIGWGVYIVYCATADTFAWVHKRRGRGLSYKEGLRKCKKKVRKTRNEFFSLHGYSSSDTYYRKMIEAERELAEYMDEDYEEPARKPKLSSY